MARATRKRASSPVQVEVEVEVEQDQELDQENGAAPLQFNEPLTWRAGKAIAVSELLQRLKRLYEELAPMHQEEADRETLVPVAQELAHTQLLAHRDKGVKAWTALCVVEMFRLLAPDAPYKERQLKEIFQLFVSTIVPAMATPSDPYSVQHLNILMSLTTVKSIVLLTDIPGSDHLILTLFTNCFDVMSGNARGGSGEQLPKNIEYHMTNMLCTLVDECAALPTGVIDIILAQFLRADPSTLSLRSKKTTQAEDNQMLQQLREVSPAYNMARSICNTCAEKMSRTIGQYFSSVLIDASEVVLSSKGNSKGRKRQHDDHDEESEDGMLTPPAEDDLREVEKAHRLLRELWRSSPDAIQNIVPQIEAESSAENVTLRTLAVETVGDMISGIGAAGLPAPMPLDSSAYPSHSLDSTPIQTVFHSILMVPAAPHAFSFVYPAAYQSFLDRRRDKSTHVRAAWALECGRIITTSGGGKGLDTEEERRLSRYLADMLVDNDEKVRLAAIQAVSRFSFGDIVQKLGLNGSVTTAGSVLSNLSDRIKDRKHHVRIAATELLGRIWGVAAGAIAEGSDRISTLLGAIPSKILDAIYINDRELTALVQKVIFESVLPLGYPPIRPRAAFINGDSQRVRDSQATGGAEEIGPDPDAVRVERILVLVRDLDQRAKTVFFKMQERQAGNARYLEALIKSFEEFNGGVTDKNEKETKKRMDKLIEYHSNLTPDPMAAADHLRRFAKMHDRRCYQLIRFCYSPESDYRKVFKAMKELTKRIDEAAGATSAILETLLPIVKSAAVLVYNRSHVPAIMEISSTDEKGLGAAAHETLKEISTKAPEVFKVHVHELCRTLVDQAPSTGAANDAGAVDILKACAGFARNFPAEMPQDRKFFQAMTEYAIRGTPSKAAKYAVSVVLASADKKEMYAKDILKRCTKDFTYGSVGYLSKLAALSQLRRLASKECEDENDAIVEIAIQKVLTQAQVVPSENDSEWTDDIDDDLRAQLWALKILVNGLRGFNAVEASEESDKALVSIAKPVYRLLNTLVEKDGEMSKTESTSGHHKSRLRLAAAVQLVKLSTTKRFDGLLSARDFNRLSRVAQDPIPEVRTGFVTAIKKYLGQNKLPSRFYALVFLYAFEPKKDLQTSTSTWLRGRATISAKLKDNLMESVFARFLSLLAHHQDFSANEEDLVDFVEYIMFYLKSVASEDNLPLVYHIAQRIKSVQDGIDPEASDNLYVLSDLAEAVIREFQEEKSWSLQLWSGKLRLPTGLFAALPGHTIAQDISEKRYVPEELVERLPQLVKDSLKTRKRKSDGSSSTQPAKKAKSDVPKKTTKAIPVRKAPKPAKTPKKRATDAIPSSDRRKSARSAQSKNYAEPDSEDDVEMEQWDAPAEEDKENQLATSTPQTSDPAATDPIVKEAPKPVRKVNGARGAKTKIEGKRKGAKEREKDEMDIPSDSELSEPPDEDEE